MATNPHILNFVCKALFHFFEILVNLDGKLIHVDEKPTPADENMTQS